MIFKKCHYLFTIVNNHKKSILWLVFMVVKQNDILLEKAISYTRLIANFSLHLILSIVIGPLIAVFLYSFYLILLGIDPSVSGYVFQD